jgi:hypothetical protein
LWKEKNKDENSSGSCKRTSRDDERDDKDHDKELDDTASSSLKESEEAAGKEVARSEEPNAKKKLDLEVVLKEGENMEVPPPLPIYVPPWELKRMKKFEMLGRESSTSKSRAGSEEEHH